MYESPRTRRLRNDLTAITRLRSESSVFRFTTKGDPPQQYFILLKGKGLWRDHGRIKVLETHRVEIKLGASYPRTMPEIRWITPIYHPNISEIGMVCLGGYGTHWVPSVQLDELCVMLWDMVRYHNYDIRSPYNRDAALWVASQATFLFPTDGRSLRDLRAALGRVSTEPGPAATGTQPPAPAGANGTTSFHPTRPPETAAGTDAGRVRQFIDALDRRNRNPNHRRNRAGRFRHFIERYGRIFNNGRVPAPNRLAADVGTVRPDPEPPVWEMVPDDPGQTSRDDELAGIVLEPLATIQPEPETPSPGADEIMFID